MSLLSINPFKNKNTFTIFCFRKKKKLVPKIDYSMQTPFNIDPTFLESNIFLQVSTKRSKHSLSPSFLPNLFYYIKSLMTETERSSMKDYEVQILLIET